MPDTYEINNRKASELEELLNEVYEKNKVKRKEKGWQKSSISEVFEIESFVGDIVNDVLKEVYKRADIKFDENGYLLISQGSCNTGEFNKESSDLDIQLLLPEESIETLESKVLKDYLKGKLSTIQEFFKPSDAKESRVKLWLGSLENMKDTTCFRGTGPIEEDENDGWWDLCNPVLHYLIIKTGKYIRGNKEEFKTIKDRLKDIKVTQGLGAELHFAALFDLFEGLYAQDEINYKKISKSALRGVQALYLSRSGDFLTTYGETRDIGTYLFGINNFSAEIHDILDLMHDIKVGEKTKGEYQLNEKNIDSMWNLFLLLKDVQFEMLGKLDSSESKDSRKRIDNFIKKRLNIALNYRNFENTENYRALDKIYVETVIDHLINEKKRDETFETSKEFDSLLRELLDRFLSEAKHPYNRALKGKIENFLGEHERSQQSLDIGLEGLLKDSTPKQVFWLNKLKDGIKEGTELEDVRKSIEDLGLIGYIDGRTEIGKALNGENNYFSKGTKDEKQEIINCFTKSFISSKEYHMSMSTEPKLASIVTTRSDSLNSLGRTEEAKENMLELLKEMPTNMVVWESFLDYCEDMPRDEKKQYHDVYMALKDVNVARFIDSFQGIEKLYNGKDEEKIKEEITKKTKIINDFRGYLKEHTKEKVLYGLKMVEIREDNSWNLIDELENKFEDIIEKGKSHYMPSSMYCAYNIILETIVNSRKLRDEYESIYRELNRKGNVFLFERYHEIKSRIEYMKNSDFLMSELNSIKDEVYKDRGRRPALSEEAKEIFKNLSDRTDELVKEKGLTAG